MKKTPLKAVGKIGKLNKRANKRLALAWIEHDIHFCEVCPILHEMGLLEWKCLQACSNAHRHGRVWYRSKPELLGDISQVVRACMKAHEFIDNNTEVREQVFIRLRGEELID
jgi:hypothetical protein